ncbi:MAG: general secretion pathway protein GspB [Lentisphaeria bacterium]|nr:general secretion pathway protein GspB [Lentisphaeria bacterium]
MSLINDALNEARRENGSSPGEQARVMPSPRGGGSNKGVVVALVVMGTVFTVAIGGVVILLLFLFQNVSSVREEEMAGVQRVAAVVTDKTAPPVSETALPAPQTTFPAVTVPPTVTSPPVSPAVPETTPDMTAFPTGLPTTQAAPVDAGGPGPATEAAAPVASPVPDVPAPVEIMPAPPEIKEAFVLKGIMKGRRGNMALLNSQIVRENDTLKHGARVERISETDVIIRLDGKKYRLNQTH